MSFVCSWGWVVSCLFVLFCRLSCAGMCGGSLFGSSLVFVVVLSCRYFPLVWLVSLVRWLFVCFGFVFCFCDLNATKGPRENMRMRGVGAYFRVCVCGCLDLFVVVCRGGGSNYFWSIVGPSGLVLVLSCRCCQLSWCIVFVRKITTVEARKAKQHRRPWCRLVSLVVLFVCDSDEVYSWAVFFRGSNGRRNVLQLSSFRRDLAP